MEWAPPSSPSSNCAPTRWPSSDSTEQLCLCAYSTTFLVISTFLLNSSWLASIITLVKPSSMHCLHLSLIHISEPTRLGMISYAVFCLKKKKNYILLFHKLP